VGIVAGAGVDVVHLLKNSSIWLNEKLAPEHSLETSPRDSDERQAVITTYNRLGGLMAKLACQYEVSLASIIAIWVAAGGWRPQRPSRLPICFRVNEFFEIWGIRWRQDFDVHFRFGGHSLQAGQPWENHEYRADIQGRFASVHHNQNSEYKALTLARMLSGDETAVVCLTAGGPQLPIQDYRLLGYNSGSDMFKMLQTAEITHVLSFFDMCYFKQAPRSGQLLQYLRVKDFVNFSKYYNGAVELDRLGERLQATATTVEELLDALPR
jgi:hypothetical protein